MYSSKEHQNSFNGFVFDVFRCSKSSAHTYTLNGPHIWMFIRNVFGSQSKSTAILFLDHPHVHQPKHLPNKKKKQNTKNELKNNIVFSIVFPSMMDESNNRTQLHEGEWIWLFIECVEWSIHTFASCKHTSRTTF